MKVAVITGYLQSDWHSQELVEALKHHADVVAVDPADLGVEVNGRAHVLVRGEPQDSFDAFLLARGLGERGDADFQLETYRTLSESGALVVNRVGPLLAAQDKMRTSFLCSRAGVPTPAAVAAQDLAGAVSALARFGLAVQKPLWGSLGEGVQLVEHGARGRRALAVALDEDGVVYLQAFVPNDGADWRAFVVGRRVVGAIRRKAAPGELAANLHRGGTATAVDLEPAFKRAAVAAARAVGLDYAGVDLLADEHGRPTVIEVNGNPAWRGLAEATGIDVARLIAEHVLARVKAREGKGVSQHSTEVDEWRVGRQ